MAYRRITSEELAALDGLDDWREELRAIVARFRAGSFPAAASLVSEVAALAEAAAHHPDVDVRYPDVVEVRLTTHAEGAITDADVDLARSISAAADAAGAAPEPLATQRVEWAIDTTDPSRIRPFWAAVLGYAPVGDDELHDPARIGPPLWFQVADERRPGRGRAHVDVTVPHDVAEARLTAALAAGGTLVTEAYAPSWWVLADADGNEVCICTWQSR